jgi:hypothetical protein
MNIIPGIWIQDIHTTIEKTWVPIHLALNEYDLIDKSYNHKDVFDIMTHFIVKEICDEAIAGLQSGIKTVLYLNTQYNLRTSSIIEYGADTQKAITRLENLIPKLIPAYVIKKPYPLYYDFIIKYNGREIDAVHEIEKISLKFEKYAFKPFNLNKLIKYLDKRGLKYLSSDYFQQVNNKLLAANK